MTGITRYYQLLPYLLIADFVAVAVIYYHFVFASCSVFDWPGCAVCPCSWLLATSQCRFCPGCCCHCCFLAVSYSTIFFYRAAAVFSYFAPAICRLAVFCRRFSQPAGFCCRHIVIAVFDLLFAICPSSCYYLDHLLDFTVTIVVPSGSDRPGLSGSYLSFRQGICFSLAIDFRPPGCQASFDQRRVLRRRRQLPCQAAVGSGCPACRTSQLLAVMLRQSAVIAVSIFFSYKF